MISSNLMLKINWIIKYSLAQSSYPHTKYLDYLHSQGIAAIVSLEKREDKDIIDEMDFDYLEVPVKDYTAPSIEELEKISLFIYHMIRDNRPVLVHCLAGGRSGTVIAAYLIRMGKSCEDAIQEVKDKIPGAIQVPVQMKILKKYESWVS